MRDRQLMGLLFAFQNINRPGPLSPPPRADGRDRSR
jgi:hypothetical protein